MKRIFLCIALAIFSCARTHAQLGAQTLKTAWIINEDFNNNDHDWYQDSTKTYEIHVRDKYYSLWNKDSAGRVFVHNFTQSFEKDDYKIEASIEHSTGDD